MDAELTCSPNLQALTFDTSQLVSPFLTYIYIYMQSFVKVQNLKVSFCCSEMQSGRLFAAPQHEVLLVNNVQAQCSYSRVLDYLEVSYVNLSQ